MKLFAALSRARSLGQRPAQWIITCLLFFVVLPAWPERIGANAPAPRKTLALGLDTPRALIQIIRKTATPELVPQSPQDAPPLLDEAASVPLIVTLYHNGHPKWQHVSTKPTLRASAEDAGKTLAELFAKLPPASEIRSEALLQIDIVLKVEPLPDATTYMLPRYLTCGLTDLRYTGKERVVFFAPLAVFRQWHKPDIVTALFKEQESRGPFVDFLADCIQATSFVEGHAGGPTLQVYRGNVLRPQPTPDRMLRVLSRAGIRLVKLQREDGAFPGPIHPMGDNVIVGTNDIDVQLRAAITLIRLHQLVGEKTLDDAAERALKYVLISLHNDHEREILSVPSRKKAVESSALLLTALCLRALQDTIPTADGRMQYLGNFLCLMTTRDGRLYSRVPASRRDKPPYEVQGEAYAEALMALALLQQISPSRTTLGTVDRLAALVSAGSNAPPFPVPRTVEALAEYYKVKQSARQTAVILSLAEKMAKRQIKNSPYADYLGGFSKPDLPPDALTTAQTLCALSSAYQIAKVTGRPTEVYSDALMPGAMFLANLQFRRENSFFLPLRDWAEGAFRTSPEDLHVRLLENAETIRALVLAASITARTVAPESSNLLENNTLK